MFDDLDRGDWVGVEGTVMATRKGELSVKVTSFVLLSKALRPLPDKWKGLSDIDQRYRQRYVDLVVNHEARRVLDDPGQGGGRAAPDAGAIRATSRSRRPMMNLVQGGATARPFVTHYNALDLDTYLRIALELPLKRLIVGGMERVFEIGRIFRNEGIDTRHNPEFTMLEAYAAFGDYTDMMALTEDLVAAAAQAAIGRTTVTLRGVEIDLAPPWRRATMAELITEVLGVDAPRRPCRSSDARGVLDGLGLAWKDVVGRRPAHPRGLRRAGREPRWTGPSSSTTTPARPRRWPSPTATTRPWSSGSR